MELLCNSCGKNLISSNDFVQFKCPSCGETKVIRCKKCRRKQNIYKCKECGFEGP